MNNYKLADVQNLEMTVKKRNGYKSYTTKFGVKPFMAGRTIDWQVGPENGNFEAAVPEKGKKKDDWAWTITPYDDEKFQEKYSRLVDVAGEGEGYIDLNAKQEKGLNACIASVPEDEDPIVIVKKEALKTSSGQSYSAYKFTLVNIGDAPE